MKSYDFIANPIRKFKLIKIGKIRICPVIAGIVLAVTALLLLSTWSISDADAGYVRNGEFKIGMSLSDYSMYTGDNLNVTIFFTNLSQENQLITFNGSCQATYQIFDESGQLYYPTQPEETPCNNRGYEQFVMAPGQLKRYYFSLVNILGKPTVFKEGKYTIIGTVDGFGQTEPQKIEVLAKPSYGTKSSEGELCNGMTMKTCTSDLECKYEGGFPGGAGMCFSPDTNFTPENKCESGFTRCFNDTVNHAHFEIIQKYLVSGEVKGGLDGNFYPDEPIQAQDFIKLLEKISNKKVDFKVSEGNLSRIVALRILYFTYFEKEPAIKLSDSPFTDMHDNPYKDYSTAAYNFGIINLNSEKKFYPNNHLTRAHALVLIDKFENL